MSQNLPVPEDDALANVLMDLAAQGVTQASIFTAAAALTQSVAYEYDALPLKFEHSTLYVALDENDSATVKNLSAAVRFKVIVLANIDLRLIRRALPKVYPPEQNEDIEAGEVILEDIVKEGVRRHAIDATIVPLHEDGSGCVRYNVDTTQVTWRMLNPTQLARVVTTIFTNANVQPSTRIMPGSGRMTRDVGRRSVELRVATYPLYDNRVAITIRFLKPFDFIPALHELGMFKDQIELIMKTITRKGVMISISGPTGEGKTTTLYSILSSIDLSTIKTMSAEDPIECIIPNMIQSQIRETIADESNRFDWAAATRALVRHNPDLAFFGEIRDAATASNAETCSTSGSSLIYSTHARDAIRVIDRLVELGAKRAMIASHLTLSISQRLLKRLCEHCRIHAVPSSEARLIARSFDIPLDSVYSANPDGCEYCNHLGYSGMIAAFEMIRMSPQLAAAIVEEKWTNELLMIAATSPEHPYRPMILAALRHMGAGLTSEAEITRRLSYDDIEWMRANPTLNWRAA